MSRHNVPADAGWLAQAILVTAIFAVVLAVRMARAVAGLA